MRTVVGNDVFYSVLGIPALVPTEVVFTVSSESDYITILRYTGVIAGEGTEFYLNGNLDAQDFLIRLGDDCTITGIDRNGDTVLDAVIAYTYLRGTVVSEEPLRVSVPDGQKPAVALGGVSGLTKGQECRCLFLGGNYYIVP